jgi:hypothetical protein
MRRLLTIGFMALALMMAIGVSAEGVEAKAPAFKKAPTFTEIGLRLNIYGSITGLEASADFPNDTKVFLIGYGTLKVECFDPSATFLGEVTASFASVQGIQYVADSQLRPSGMAFSVTTAAPGLTPEQAGCPGGSTYTSSVDTTYTVGRVVVVQAGQVVLDQTFYL